MKAPQRTTERTLALLQINMQVCIISMHSHKMPKIQIPLEDATCGNYMERCNDDVHDSIEEGTHRHTHTHKYYRHDTKLKWLVGLVEFYDADTMLDDSCLAMTPPASSQPSTTPLAHETSPPSVTAPMPSTTGDDAELPTSESVVSSVSHGASVSTNSQLWEVEQATEINKCTSFSLKTCGCKMADEKPCSSLFSADYYIETRSQASLLTRQQLDLVLLGSVMTTTSVEKDVSHGRHKPTKRMRLSTQFMHRGHQLCKVTFNFLYGVVKHRVPAIRKSFVSDGLELQTHGNT